MSRPLVGVTAWRRELPTFLGPEMLHTLSDYYTSALISAGMTPVIFPNRQDPEEAARLVESVDGLLLSGGGDVDPATYETPTEETSTGYDRAVDDFEIALVREARLRSKPVLAICRGIQLLNVAMGGTLSQEITEEGTIHEPIPDDIDPEILNQRGHVVHLDPESVLATALDSTEIKANTLHHQGIRQLAPDLIVEGRTEDGLIEAARCRGEWWALGVQWHPERTPGPDQQRLFDAFREAITA